MVSFSNTLKYTAVFENKERERDVNEQVVDTVVENKYSRIYLLRGTDPFP